MTMPHSKAADSLRAAEVLLDQHIYDSCASRAYYAIYQIAWCRFDEMGLTPDRTRSDSAPYWAHDRLSASMGLHLELDQDEQEEVEILLSSRIKADYYPEHLDAGEASESFELAEKLFRLLEEV